MKRHLGWFAALGLFCVILVVFAYSPGSFPGGINLMHKLRGRFTVTDRLAEFGPRVQGRWQPYFTKKHLAYPPRKILLVGLKQEKRLQVYAADSGDSFQLIRTFPVQKASGKLGPKLRSGDSQVPEGFYRIESLNPNSAFHLSLRLNYPNDFDRLQAEKEGRTELGSDIMIHGSNASVGCLAMGDEAAEDLFVLAAKTGVENIDVILSPVDFRVGSLPQDAQRPAWVDTLYAEIKIALLKLPAA